MTDDPDPVTRAELAGLLARGAADELADRFAGRLRFGTSGLRAPMGAGPARMNRRVVRELATGLGQWLGEGARVVVGRDARHRSDAFAADTAGVLAALGCEALVLPGPLPTPVLAFAVRHLGADAGVMVTASHNPPGDNGWKVYLADGAQPVPPVDAELVAAMDAAAGRAVEPVDAADPRIVALDDAVVDAYVARALGVLAPGGARDLRVAYTPLHGVGGSLLLRLFARAGFPPPVVVAAQAEPDPDFPTVAYPNPEEPGALDLVLAEAAAHGADLVLAHDPDADRLGVAAPRDGRWTPLDGNQIAALLADHLLARTTGPDRLVVRTLVSSSLLDRMAEAHGVHHAETLTGFRWVVRVGMAHPEWRWVLGFEEALGYSVDGYVRDKDGLTAALVVAELAADLRAEGRTVWDRLDDLARTHGHHLTASVGVRFSGPGAGRKAAARLAALRAAPPASLGGRAVRAVEDLADGGRLPPADVVILHLDGGARVALRPSGTEPKLKGYVEVVAGDGDTARTALDAVTADLRALLEAPTGGGR
jgi:phosphomannomutase